MMKLAHWLPLILLSFLFSHDHQYYYFTEGSPDVHGFLVCLPRHSSPRIPILKHTYPRQSPHFYPVLHSRIKNLRFNKTTTPKPLVIVAAAHESHVQATILCARAKGLGVRIRSGGHDYEGFSYVSDSPFVILDMFNLRRIDIDLKSETAWVQAGATLGEVYTEIAKKTDNHAFPGGLGPSVGVGGHITGGGYGTLIRKYGLTVDNVVDARVVNVRGRILTRRTMGKHLYWAIRGGGAASFCVLLSWRIKLVRVPKIVTCFKVKRTLEENATQIMQQWQRVAPNIEEDLFIRAQPEAIKREWDNKKTVQVAFYALYLGQTEALLDIINPIFPLLGVTRRDCIEMRWVESNLFWNDLPMSTKLDSLLQASDTLQYKKYKSDYVQKLVPKKGWEAIWAKMIEVGSVYLQFNPGGGRMREIPPGATPYPHRAGNVFKIQYLAEWSDGGDEAEHQHMKAIESLHQTFTPYVSSNPRTAFLDYRDVDLGNNTNGNISFALDYFKGNVNRLIKVKTKVDPYNFFKDPQSIPIASAH